MPNFAYKFLQLVDDPSRRRFTEIVILYIFIPILNFKK